MKIKSTIIVASLLLAGFNGFANEGKQEQKEKDKSKQEVLNKAKKERQVSGTILKHKSVKVAPKGQAQQQTEESKAMETLVVLLKTKKGNERLVVDLGKVEALPEIQDGKTELQAEGRLVKIGEKELFVARTAKIDNKKIELQRERPMQAQEESKKEEAQSASE